MKRHTADILVLLTGGALIRITTDGTYLRYVKPTAHWWLLAAGTTMVLLATTALRRHETPNHTTRSTWLLALPVLAVFFVTPPALGADSVLRADFHPVPARTNFAPLPTKTTPITLSEFIARSVWDPESLTHRTVTLTGFVVHNHGTDYLARLVITCCAADATSMQTALTGHTADDLPNDQWITATGELRPGSATTADDYTPTLAVTSLTTTDPPKDPYE